MLTINRFFIAITQLVLLINSTQQSYVKQAMTAAKTFGNTMKSSMTILRQNKNTIKNIAYGVQKKYLKTKHSFASKSVKHLGVEAIKKFKHTAPQAARGGKQLFRTESKKNIQMKSGSQINRKDLGSVIKRSAEYMRGKELSSLINMVSKSKPMLPFISGAALIGITEFRVLPSGPTKMSMDDGSAKDKLTLENGVIYEGEAVNGKPDGKGKLIYPDGGDVYEGEFHNGQIQGKGKRYFKNGDVYHGQFVDGKIKGVGQMNYKNGNVYIGAFKDDKENGLGNQRTASKNLYIGNFVDGKLQGDGTFVAENFVRKYYGNFVDGKITGKGKTHYNNQHWYEGEHLDGNRHGQGAMTYDTGAIFEGAWENDVYTETLDETDSEADSETDFDKYPDIDSETD